MEEYDTDVFDEGGWAEALPFGPDAPATGGASAGETDWAAIVASALGGTAAIITAATGQTTAPKSYTPSADPFGGKKASTGVPMWVWGAAAVGGLLLLSRRSR